jgi:hypothetical protein
MHSFLSLRTQQAQFIFAISVIIYFWCFTHIDQEPSISPTKFKIATFIAQWPHITATAVLSLSFFLRFSKYILLIHYNCVLQTLPFPIAYAGTINLRHPINKHG